MLNCKEIVIVRRAAVRQRGISKSHKRHLSSIYYILLYIIIYNNLKYRYNLNNYLPKHQIPHRRTAAVPHLSTQKGLFCVTKKIIAHFFCTSTNYCYLCIKYRRYVVKTALVSRGLNP